jgi:hypothetical protein
MKHFIRALVFGLIVWAVPFIVAMVIYPLYEYERPLFESIMPVAVALSASVFTVFYLNILEMDFLKESIYLGILWFVICIGIDLLMFSWGPMKMNFGDYMKDIGITYLMIPVITITMGWLEEKRFKKMMKWVPPAK